MVTYSFISKGGKINYSKMITKEVWNQQNNCEDPKLKASKHTDIQKGPDQQGLIPSWHLHFMEIKYLLM